MIEEIKKINIKIDGLILTLTLELNIKLRSY